jgi:NitT/TauT family transport system substrate-binding protein
MTSSTRREFLAASGAAIAAAGFVAPARAQTLRKIKVGKSVTTSFPFAGLEIGQESGIWKKHGFDIEIAAFRGDGQLQQAMTAGAIDFGFGSGVGMGYAAKGVPAHAVASIADKPQNMALIVGMNSNIKSVADLKGKRIGVTTAGSLTDWLARAIAKEQGWKQEDIEVVPMGEIRTRLPAMKSGEIPANVTATESAFELQQQGEGRVLLTFGEIVTHFHTHVVFALDKYIKDDPELVKSFLQAWFEIAKHIKDNRAATVKTVARVMSVSEPIVDQAYDIELSMMSFDGAFDPKAIEIIRQSLKELEILDFIPETKDMYVDKFVPVVLK